jgi:hypothetical protein
VQVVNGLFSVELDFDQQYATQEERYLAIEVRSIEGLDCTDAADFLELLPRQRITSSPMATHAMSAFALDAPDGSLVNAVFVDNDGRVGIGTTTPSYPLHIAAAEPAMLLQDTGSNSTQTGSISFWNGTQTLTAWVGFGLATDPHFSVVNVRPSGNIRFVTVFGERVTIVPGGNVGIGTTTPQVRLDVRGNVKMGTSGELFATGGEENLRIIRGTIAGDGTRVRGSGFTPSHPGTGDYAITFTTPFGETPTVTASLEYPGSDLLPTSLQPNFVSEQSANIVCRYYDENGIAFPLNREFHFIVVGPR